MSMDVRSSEVVRVRRVRVCIYLLFLVFQSLRQRVLTLSCFFNKQDVSYCSKRTMKKNSPSRTVIMFFVLLVLVVGLSIVSN
jgi:hypothetical protein